ncbi:MAG: tyrosine-type recombinase/integrase [Deltaproteobacteria bacterium]|nr:tyrosine-type recombinase/integrase [Deltaproteobacteria bacterium]
MSARAPEPAPAPSRRRQRGSGGISTVRRRRGDGSTSVRYRARLRSPAGRVVFDGTYADPAAAQRALREAAALNTLGEVVPQDRLPVAPLLDEYLATIRVHRTARSCRSAELWLRRWIRPYFAGYTLGQLNSAAELRRFVLHLRQAQSEFTHRPLALGTIRHIVEVVSSFLEMCRMEGRIRVNHAREEYVGRRQLRPARRVNLPGGERGWLSIADARRYQEVAWTAPYGDLCVFLLHSALRNAEARGLCISRCQLEADPPYIEVRAQIVHADPAPGAPPIGARPNPGYAGRGRAQVLTTQLKTPASYRDLYCDPVMLAILRGRLAGLPALRLAAARWDERYDLVFTGEHGAPIAYHCLRAAHLRICRAAGVRPVGLHGLRHTAFALLLSDGVPLIEVQRIAGHANLRLLEQIYAYVLHEQRGRGAASLGRLLPLLQPLPSGAGATQPA